jgi:O-antigen ligase
MASLTLTRNPLSPVHSPRLARTKTENSVAFVLFLMVNASLYIRPADFIPGLIGWPIFQVLILACLLFSFSCVLRQFSRSELARRPITVCMLGLLLLAILSNLANFYFASAVSSGLELLKIVVYYLLLVGLIDSPARLRQFLFTLTLLLATLATLGVLTYHGAIALPNLTVLHDGTIEEATGQQVTIPRLRCTSLFGDPNEICLVLVFGLALCVYWVGERRMSLFRYLWLAPLVLFAYALSLTQSRGGFLALIAAVMTYLYIRYGRAKTLLFGALVCPLLLVMFAGRQTQVSTGEHTARARIDLWDSGLVLLRENPLFGVGHNQFVEIVGMVAHNSFLHCYAELGLVGGTLFLGLFYVSWRQLNQLNAPGRCGVDPDLCRLAPCLTAGITGYIVGMMSVTYSYALPTYTVLGIATACVGLATTPAPQPRVCFNGRLLARLLGIGLVYLILLQLFVRIAQ